MRETSRKIIKNDQNQHFCGYGGWGEDKAERPKPLRDTSRTQTKICLPNFNFPTQHGGEKGQEQLFFKVKKGKNPHIHHPD